VKFRLLPSLLILAVGLVNTACSKKDSAENANEIVVKIGSVSPLTGPQSHLGKDNENGARMALDEANTQHILLGGKPVKFVLISEDDGADPKTATSVAQKLADQKINGVIGHLNSGTSIPASKIYHDAGIAQISPSATAIKYTAQGYNTAFRVMTNDAQQGRVLGQFAVSKMGAKKIAIIDDRSAYGQGLADEVEKAAKAAGAEIVAREFTTDKSTDFTAILTSIKSKNPDLIFFGGMDPQAAPMVQQMKRLGLKAKFLGGDGVQTAEFLTLAGADGEGVTASNPGVPLAGMPGGVAFEQKFNAKYGKIQNYAPYAYDAVNVMIAAMRHADSADPAKYLPELAKASFAGVTGNIQFDAKGDLTNGNVTLYQVKNGKWEPVETVKNAEPAPAK
jgi:branched-chain amino acid transport system substrate-binding protein